MTDIPDSHMPEVRDPGMTDRLEEAREDHIGEVNEMIEAHRAVRERDEARRLVFNLEKENAEVRAKLALVIEAYDEATDDFRRLVAENAKTKAEKAELLAVVKPFAETGALYGRFNDTDNFRTAHEVYTRLTKT